LETQLNSSLETQLREAKKKMRFEDATKSIEDTRKKTGIRPTKEGKYAIYLNYTTKALTLLRIIISKTLQVNCIFTVKIHLRRLKKDEV
jgi:hypothetical protein